MHAVAPQRLRAIEITRTRDGGLEHLTVDLPTAWRSVIGTSAVISVGSFVYLAEGDFDELIDTVWDSRAMQSLKPGVVLVDGAEVRWARVDRAAYDDAWTRVVTRAREPK